MYSQYLKFDSMIDYFDNNLSIKLSILLKILKILFYNSNIVS